MINEDYIAGFFDGEGSVGIKVSADKRKRHNIFVGGRIDIVQANLEILEEIKEVLGYGNIVKRIKYKANHSQTWYLQIQDETQLRDFINRFRDKLQLKRKQLDILLNFFNKRKLLTNGKYRAENTLKLLEFAKEMQMANRGRITEILKKRIRELKNAKD